jgi:hypothetical protein
MKNIVTLSKKTFVGLTGVLGFLLFAGVPCLLRKRRILPLLLTEVTGPTLLRPWPLVLVHWEQAMPFPMWVLPLWEPWVKSRKWAIRPFCL